MHLANFPNNPSPLDGEGMVRGSLLEKSPLMPTFYKAFKEVGIVPIT
jgi:hypothetical protein